MIVFDVVNNVMSTVDKLHEIRIHYYIRSSIHAACSNVTIIDLLSIESQNKKWQNLIILIWLQCNVLYLNH